MLRKIVSALLFLMFVVFAYLQFNDPDPEVWVPAYMVPAILCAWSGFSKVPFILPSLVIAIAIGWAFTLWPEHYNGITGAMTPGSGIEEARESLGLMIVAAGMVWVIWTGRKKPAAN